MQVLRLSLAHEDALNFVQVDAPKAYCGGALAETSFTVKSEGI